MIIYHVIILWVDQKSEHQSGRNEAHSEIHMNDIHMDTLHEHSRLLLLLRFSSSSLSVRLS